MSGKLIGQIYEIELGHGEQSVLVAMADHAQDDGSDCFPSIARLEWKTGYDRRHIQRVLRKLEEDKILIRVAEATRRHPIEYRIDVAAGVSKPPFELKGQDVTRGGISDTEGRHLEQPGAVPRPPEPSIEPSEETSSQVGEVVGHHREVFASVLRRREVYPDERRIVTQALEVATVDEAKACIDACAASDFHMKRGEHAGRKGSKHYAIGDIFKPKIRSGQTWRGRVDMWLDRAGESKPAEVDENEQAARLRAAQEEAWS